MSPSIRPPGAKPPGLGGPGAVGEAADGVAESAPSAEGKPSTGVAEAPGGGSAEWLRRLDAGEIDRAQAVEGLVAQALEAHGGGRLSAAQRSELADVLRESLLQDPVLGALLGE